jgi:hypothetical protein
VDVDDEVVVRPPPRRPPSCYGSSIFIVSAPAFGVCNIGHGASLPHILSNQQNSLNAHAFVPTSFPQSDRLLKAIALRPLRLYLDSDL